ncbi:MAG: RagB/SusD family nutrient uptake outer membrane protein, partial [Prevotellaceae bacterium]|nr:RagB/SusD family nutrient uptake outer membrane protein [Prevotellaceae bacterium]
MKNISLYTAVILSCMSAMTSCDDDFMNEIPQTSITVSGYFNTVSDLETYTNNFYSMLSWGGIRDADSDNVTGPGHSEGSETWQVVNDLLNAGNVGGWGQWWNIRSANVLLDNVERVKGVEADINHHIGFARYIRAMQYIDLVRRYSDVPYIEHAISSDDPDVYRASDPRAYVVDKIMEDLEYASANMKSDLGNRTRVNKYCALALLSRFALYEGTYRKYHAELNLQSTANRFLERAVTASEEVMKNEQFAIADTSVDNAGGATAAPNIKGCPAYRALFASLDLSSNKEVIQWVQFRPDIDQNYNMGAVNITMFGLSRSLMESYLTADGKPYSSVSGYATLPYFEGFANRDPRLAENFAHPGSSSRSPSFVKY